MPSNDIETLSRPSEIRTEGEGDGREFHKILLVGNFGPPLLAFARCCAALGISTNLLEISAKPLEWRRFSSALDDMSPLDPRLVGTFEGIQAIKRQIAETNSDALIAVSEAHLLWLSAHRSEFEPGCKLLSPAHEVLAKLASKMSQIAMASEAGFDILPTWYLSDAAGYGNVPEQEYPVCVRPSEPTKVVPSFKACVIHSPNALKEFLETLEQIEEPIIAQPFFDAPDLKVHGVRSETGQFLAMEPFLVERKFEGVSLTLRRGSLAPTTLESCKRFAELSGLVGGFHFDLLYVPARDKVYYLEINVRMGGITDKARALGYDQPRLILEAYGDRRPQIPPIEGTSRGRVVTKRAVIKHMVSALAGKLTELDYPPVGRAMHVLLSLRDLLFARDSVTDRQDKLGSAWFNFQKFESPPLRRWRRRQE